ncbi:Integrase family protein [Desulfonema limicola]|uniref:Integrase family protein n=1 Tax=Desulfonema limicola TaxID=45656 RepID=A0A975B9N4_9BACT|nr:phage integrase SAM-like domain-containing protein [Desulfonema limicola]QTA81294.1 Integrase family protein [Desulfonema limicola]
MIRFKSFLSKHFEDFLVYRMDAGYKYGRLRWYLSTLDQYLAETGVKINQVTPDFLLDFRSRLKGEPGTANRVFIILKAFFDYLIRIDFIKDNPFKEIPLLREKSYIPFVFSPGQVDEILKNLQMNIRKTNPHLFLADLAAYNALLMTARCGMRISEPLGLKDKDFRTDLLCACKGPASKGLVYRAFHRAVKDAGIKRTKQNAGNTTFGHTRVHSFRHSFAVNTLKDACERGLLPENVLPVLAAYMGHSDYRYTMKYLKVIDAEHFGGWADFCIFKRDREGA